MRLQTYYEWASVKRHTAPNIPGAVLELPGECFVPTAGMSGDPFVAHTKPEASPGIVAYTSLEQAFDFLRRENL